MSIFSEIKEYCYQYHFKPLRRRGQNFLINQRVYDKIIEVAEIKKDDIVLEIGAGLGFLTRELAKKAKKVIAVEIDKKLVEILKERLKDYRNIEIVQEDILELQVTCYKLHDYKVVANLPYHITGAVLRKFLSERPKPKLMVLMIQKEVAQRICAQPPKMSLLSVMVQFYSQPEIIQYVSKNNFWPRPKVDSAILKITQIHRDKKTNEDRFFWLVRAGFSNPRKFLLNNLIKKKIFNREEGEKIFQRLNLNPKIRAQELGVNDWLKLATKNVQRVACNI